MASTSRDNFYQTGIGGATTLSQLSGEGRVIIGDAVATRTLLPQESGALCLMDRAAGVIYTLPTPAIGLWFEFATTVSRTTNAHKIITASITTQFLLGEVFMYTTATASGAGFAADGSTIAALSSNGTTTGGVIGDRYRVTALSTTQWLIDGTLVGSGTIATPFATS